VVVHAALLEDHTDDLLERIRVQEVRLETQRLRPIAHLAKIDQRMPEHERTP
jgi:hypothetical protein